MKSAYKGIGVIGLATGATVLAISLIGCSKPEDDKTASVVTESSAVKEASGKLDHVNTEGSSGATSSSEAKTGMAAVSKSDAIVPPPPGLFRDVPNVTLQTQPQAPAFPEAPTAPENATTPVKPADPVQPAAPVVIKAPNTPEAPKKASMESNVQVAAPQSPKMKVQPAVAPVKAKASEPAKHAVEMAAPSPSVPAAPLGAKPLKSMTVEPHKMEAPVAPVMNKPKMEKPVVNAGTGNQGGQHSMSMPTTSMNMPNMRMPSPNMQMPNMRMPTPNMNMGNGQMVPNMGSAPRMYFVPMPMYQYGQPYAPYGYMGGAPTMQQQSGQPQKSHQPQQPQTKE